MLSCKQLWMVSFMLVTLVARAQIKASKTTISLFYSKRIVLELDSTLSRLFSVKAHDPVSLL